MEVKNEFKCYGYKVLEMDNGKFHLILNDDIKVLNRYEECIVWCYVLRVQDENKRLRRANKWWIFTASFFATLVGILAVNMVM